MSAREELLAVKRRLEADLFAINRSLSLLDDSEQPRPRTSTTKDQPPLFDEPDAPTSLIDGFKTVLKSMGDTFTVRDLERGLAHMFREKHISRNTLYGMINKAREDKLMHTVKPSLGRRAALYGKPSNNGGKQAESAKIH